jgi:hypothetical protein
MWMLGTVFGALAVARGGGDGTAEIADELFLSAHTVRDHVKAIFAKVGVSSRGELVARLFAEHYQPAHLQDVVRPTATEGLSPPVEEVEQVGVELVLVRGDLGQAVGAPGYSFRVASGTSSTDRRAEAPMGTIWSSSPWMIRVGTSIRWRSSVRSVSEKALTQS